MTVFWWWVLRIWAFINLVGIAFLMGRGEYDEEGDKV